MKKKFNQDQYNHLLTSLLHTLTLLPNPFYLPLLSYSFINPQKSSHQHIYCIKYRLEILAVSSYVYNSIFQVIAQTRNLLYQITLIRDTIHPQTKHIMCVCRFDIYVWYKL